MEYDYYLKSIGFSKYLIVNLILILSLFQFT
jgi:hypothetical protein